MDLILFLRKTFPLNICTCFCLAEPDYGLTYVMQVDYQISEKDKNDMSSQKGRDRGSDSGRQ